MRENMFPSRHVAAALLAIATFIVMAALAPTGVQAQPCGNFRGDSSYQVKVSSSWPIALGLVGVSVNVEDAATGSVSTYNHTGMTAGSTSSHKFNVSNPSRTYSLSTVTLTYCTDHVFFQVPCYANGGNPIVYCAPIICNNNSYCVQITYSNQISGSGGIPTITISAVAGSCPGTCTLL